MKTIKLIETEQIGKSAGVIKMMLETGQGQGMVLREIRDRMKIIDKLEGADGQLTLEDAEYETLRAVTESFRFTRADKELLKILDSILSPETKTEEKRK